METTCDIRLVDAPLDPAAETELFRARHLDCGAIATFIGQVRDEDGSVMSLVIDCYRGFSEQEIERIADEARARWKLAGLAIVHRIGAMAAGAPIVFVAAASAHRREAIEAVGFLMDYLKSEAPLWKREVTTTGERWIEPRAEDYTVKKRWTR